MSIPEEHNASQTPPQDQAGHHAQNGDTQERDLSYEETEANARRANQRFHILDTLREARKSLKAAEEHAFEAQCCIKQTDEEIGLIAADCLQMLGCMGLAGFKLDALIEQIESPPDAEAAAEARDGATEPPIGWRERLLAAQAAAVKPASHYATNEEPVPDFTPGEAKMEAAAEDAATEAHLERERGIG